MNRKEKGKQLQEQLKHASEQYSKWIKKYRDWSDEAKNASSDPLLQKLYLKRTEQYRETALCWSTKYHQIEKQIKELGHVMVVK